MDIASSMVNLIRDIINDQLAQEDATVICKITAANSDGTVDIAIVPDLINTFSHINNETKHQFQPGDYALLYKVDNKINNSFIVAAVNPVTIDKRSNVIESHANVEFKKELKEYINTQIQSISGSGGGGGGGGTTITDYAQLSNKPSINAVTLVGNKTSADLGIANITSTDVEITEG